MAEPERKTASQSQEQEPEELIGVVIYFSSLFYTSQRQELRASEKALPLVSLPFGVRVPLWCSSMGSPVFRVLNRQS